MDSGLTLDEPQHLGEPFQGSLDVGLTHEEPPGFFDARPEFSLAIGRKHIRHYHDCSFWRLAASRQWGQPPASRNRQQALNLRTHFRHRPLQSAYTQWFNRRHGRVGHLFQGRYKAFLIEKDRYLLALVRYINRNPLEAGLATRAEDYAWSSDRYYRLRKPPDWLDVDRVLPLLGPTRGVAVARYRRLMGDQVEESYEDVKSYAQAIKGDEAFADRVLRESGVPPIVVRLSEAKVVSVVAAGLGVGLRDLIGGGRQRSLSRARNIAAYVGRAAGGIPVARMARYFGREESTLARGVVKLEETLANEPAVRRTVARLTASLQAR
jgi:putative transposase